MPLSSVAYGDTRWPGFKVFALCAGYAHILARLRSVAGFCLWKGLKSAAIAATTTLSGEAAVKPENLRGESPVKL